MAGVYGLPADYCMLSTPVPTAAVRKSDLSRYERLSAECQAFRRQQALILGMPASIAALVAFLSADHASVGLFLARAALGVVPVGLHWLLRIVSARYRRDCRHASAIRKELDRLQRRIADVFAGYRARRRGESFKKAYGLAGRDIRGLEEALAVGMYREQREVFVTAFMRSGRVVRVTASMGSLYRCGPADDPARWQHHIDRLGCDELRQYHNHPVHTGRTRPSAADIKTSRSLARMLGAHGPKLRSFIICWNAVGEWRVSEYDASGGHWSHFEFDIAG